MIIFLFGLPGAGKSYVGKLLARERQLPFWDGDNALDEEMKDYIRQEKNFTPQMTAKLSQTLIKEIKQRSLASTTKPFIVSQAMLRECDRALIRQHFSNLLFIQVKASAELLDERIKTRNDWVSPEYAQKINLAFQLSHQDKASIYPALINDGQSDNQLMEQFEQLLEQWINEKSLTPSFFTRLTPIPSKPTEKETTLKLA